MSPEPQTLVKQTIGNQIRQVLEQRILDGTLPPGTRLVELDIAREFQTSQAPVREALEGLKSSRLAEGTRYRGTFVRAISEQEMEEAYIVRGTLEQLAAELAAPNLKGDVREIRSIFHQLQQAAQAHDITGYATFNHQFHRAIVAASGNQLLLETWQTLQFEARVRIQLSQRAKPNLIARAAEHKPILDALASGDGLLAGRYSREHAYACLLRWKQRHSPEEEPDTPYEVSSTVPAIVLS
jgi:Transcriptional regulators